MRVTALRVRGFRNLADEEFAFGDRITLIHGLNGAGKTNLIEAICLALTGRSPRTRNERETIAFGGPLVRAEVDVEAGGDRHHFLCGISHKEGRRQRVDGAEAVREHDQLRPPLAVFMPDRLALVKGPPAARRGHLDRFAAALWPGRAEERRRYGRALAQRNSLLGRIRGGAAQPASLDAWDRELAAVGVELTATRHEAVEQLRDGFAEAAGALGLAGEAELRYQPRTAARDPELFATELLERRASDLSRGYTTHGPHLDELALSLADRSLRSYGSQGQQRIALLALLFAERDALLAARRVPPLMLLDDVTSELDPERRGLLCERLGAGGGQALITATEPAQLPGACPREEIGMRAGRAIASVPSAAAA